MDKNSISADKPPGLVNLSDPSFGALLIAQKLGFWWYEQRRCFIRICRYYDNLTPLFLVEFVNCLDIFSQVTSFSVYYQWWLYKNELTSSYPIIDKLQVITGIYEPIEPIKIVVNMDGFECHE